MRAWLGRAVGVASRLRARARMQVWRLLLGGLGRGSSIYPSVVIHRPSRVTIGQDVTITDFVLVWGGGGVTIGDATIIGAHTIITSQSHEIDALTRNRRYRDTNVMRPVTIGANVWIGAGARILPGVTIGRDSIIGAGSIVTRSIPERSLAVGSPARVVRALEGPPAPPGQG